MVGRYWQEIGKRTAIYWMCIVLGLGMVSCSQPTAQKDGSVAAIASESKARSKVQVEEVSPPEVFQNLSRQLDELDIYDPQLKIIGIEPDETLTDTTLSIRFQAKDFPVYKDPKLGLGPHLHVSLDDQPSQAVYDLSEAITFKDLSPGSHTVRALAVRPWDESFKTAEASAQVTFHVFAPTQANRPDPALPLLTYNSPQGEYGAEPILLDYTVTVLGQSNPTKPAQKGVASPWKVRVNLNGQTFTTTESPIYLKGFKTGVNWLKLELLNSNDKPVSNAFSETVRLITLRPKGQDRLAQLLQGDLTAQEAERIINPRVSKRLTAQDIADREEALAAEAAAKRSRALLPAPEVPKPEAPAPEAIPPETTAPERDGSSRPLSRPPIKDSKLVTPAPTRLPELPRSPSSVPSPRPIPTGEPVLPKPILKEPILKEPALQTAPTVASEPAPSSKAIPSKQSNGLTDGASPEKTNSDKANPEKTNPDKTNPDKAAGALWSRLKSRLSLDQGL